MNDPQANEVTRPVEESAAVPVRAAYERFDLSQRIEHFVFLTSFTILAITGLVQKFIESPLSIFIIRGLGGIDAVREIHHVAAFVLMWVSVYHILAVLYRLFVLRVPWSMLPLIDDFKHLFTDVAYYFGLRKRRAYYDRYNYAEKVEYLAVVWGTIIMALTGFMMWNPITTARFLPGEIIPAAKAAHGGEAILAVLAIIIWHMYHVHVKRFNKSIFTGKISHEEMEEEHPAELDRIASGSGWQRPDQSLIRQRQRLFIPVAIVLGFGLSAAVIGFVSIEPATAITTLPKGESVAIFVPITPTPRPTPQFPTSVPGLLQPGPPTWQGTFSALFSNRCGACHVSNALGGLSLSTYQAARQGGEDGPGIVPSNPGASLVVQVQQAGGHPGQLTEEELRAVIDWINAGAPEN